MSGLTNRIDAMVRKVGETSQHFTARAHPGCAQLGTKFNHINQSYLSKRRAMPRPTSKTGKQPAATASPAQLSAAHKTLLALLPDLAILVVLSAVVRLARSAALGFVSDA